MINEKAKSVNFLELVQLPNVKAVAGKDHSFKITKKDPASYSKKLSKPAKFVILSFDKNDYSQYRMKRYQRNYLNEALALFDDVQKISGNETVSALISNNKVIKHTGDYNSQEM